MVGVTDPAQAVEIGGEGVIAWLMAADPAIRWQVARDLLDADPDQVALERNRVATTGWGAEILARQDPDGRWSGGLYRPKWTGTTYTLLLLHWLGLPPGHAGALRGVDTLLNGAQWFDGGLTFADSTARHPEGCITAMVVLVGASLGSADPRLADAVQWLLDHQLPDGGWNCESVRTGSTHGSFHTSISTLDALVAYEESGGSVPVRSAITAGQDFFLRHRLYRSHRTSEVVSEAMTRFPFPPQWHFDVLRGLDHFRASGAAPDARLADAVDLLRRKCGADGRWPHYREHPGTAWFEMEGPGPSRWTTLRALRVLRWWDRA